jgi:hypothetical protein
MRERRIVSGIVRTAQRTVASFAGPLADRTGTSAWRGFLSGMAALRKFRSKKRRLTAMMKIMRKRRLCLLHTDRRWPGVHVRHRWRAIDSRAIAVPEREKRRFIGWHRALPPLAGGHASLPCERRTAAVRRTTPNGACAGLGEKIGDVEDALRDFG